MEPHCSGDQGPDPFLKEVRSLADLDEARAFAKKRNVKLNKCKSVRDVKDRLRYDWQKRNGLMKDLQVAETLMSRIHEKDVKKRAKLKALYNDLNVVLEKVMRDERLRQHLEAEKVTSSVDYGATIAKFQESLSQGHCPIILAGETSSGKSSLLNLFMEDAVLPSKLLSCTLAVCEIVYGEESAGELITEGEGKRTRTPFFYDEREQYIYKRTDRHDIFKHTVRLSVPLPFLKSGVTLVDTPGIGESFQMSRVLLDYVEQNEVYGFIYVIKSDNAGGVAKDRLQELLLHLLKLENEYGQKKVDPRTAIFICNRWDMVASDQRKAVEQDIVAKLSECWPGFDPAEQLFKMNTDFAFHTLKAGYITDDYSVLIDGIQKLLPMGLQRKLKMTYWWLDNVLVRLHHPIRVYLNRTRQTDDQVRKKKKLVDTKTQSIQKECEALSTDFQNMYSNGVNEVSTSLLEYLESDAAMAAVKTWKHRELPVEEFGDSWPIIQDKIDRAIDIRIGNMLRDWELRHFYMDSTHKKILHLVGERNKIISDHLEDLEKLIRSTSLTDSDLDQNVTLRAKRLSERLAQVRAKDVPKSLEEVEFFKDLKASIAINFGSASTTQHVLLQHALDAMLMAPELLVAFNKKKRRKTQAEEKHSQYKQDKERYVASAATSFLESMRNIDIAKQLVKMQLGDLVEYVEDVMHRTPTLLKSNKELLELIISDRRQAEEVIDTYQPLENGINQLLNKSASFAYEAVREYDMTSRAVVKEQPDQVKRIQTFKVVLDGLFAGYEVGQRKDTGKVVTTKKYQERSCDYDKVQEEKNIRSLMRKFNFIPTLLWVIQTIQKKPALVFAGELTSVRQRYMYYSFKAQSAEKYFYFKQCHSVIESLSRALDWLHIKRLVHMEVSVDSVMVDGDGRVQLSNLGESRSLSLNDSDTTGAVQSFVYLPPEVLDGELYTSASDTYAMGIFIWELWHAQRAFDGERAFSIDKFKTMSKPCDVMMKGTNPGTSSKITKLVQHCMKPKVKDRPAMRELEDMWVKTMKELKIVNQ